VACRTTLQVPPGHFGRFLIGERGEDPGQPVEIRVERALLAVFRLSDEFDRKREQLCRRDVAHIKDHELLEDNTSYGETFFVPPREYMSVALRLHSSSEFSPQPQQLLDEQAEGIDEAGSVVAGCTMALFWDIRAPSRSPDSEIRAAVPELILGPLLRHVGPTDATVWLESLAGIGAPDMDWRLTHSEPWFENHVATLELDGPHAKITFEEAIQNNSGEPDLQSIYERNLS
jgi:hypothetical protein